jgi:hypothetical protein
MNEADMSYHGFCGQCVDRMDGEDITPYLDMQEYIERRLRRALDKNIRLLETITDAISGETNMFKVWQRYEEWIGKSLTEYDSMCAIMEDTIRIITEGKINVEIERMRSDALGPDSLRENIRERADFIWADNEVDSQLDGDYGEEDTSTDRRGSGVLKQSDAALDKEEEGRGVA